MESTDSYALQQKRECWLLKKIQFEQRDDWALVRISPSIKHNEEAIDIVAIAARHKGFSIFSPLDEPISIFVAKISHDISLTQEKFQNGDLELIAWAKIYATE
jgi:hypothetical protein